MNHLEKEYQEILDYAVKNGFNTVYGHGVNDVCSPTWVRINGKREYCIYYSTWADMLKRCYSKEHHIRQPSYKDCNVSFEWLYFSKFKSWMQAQDFHNKHLDKDILIKGNKTYNKHSCCFVTRQVNNFILEKPKGSGDLPIGVTFQQNRYRARVSDGNKRIHVGYYKTPEEAHAAWKQAKFNLAIDLAKTIEDPAISTALVNRYR